MGKNKLSSGLINVVTYDTNSNISLNSGSNLLMSLSGSGKVTIPGNLVVLGGISGSTAESASYSLNADKIDNLDSTQLVLTSSFNSYTSSASSSLGSLSGSVATTTLNLSSSVSSSIGDLSGSIATTTSGLSSSIGSLSSSVATTTSGLSSSVGSLSSSVATTTSGLSSSVGSLSSSVATTTSGLAGRIGTIEGNYTTTGSNIFVGSQVITGSLYITTDLIVQGCSSLQNITASAVSIGTNTVMLNTATPAVRFAGISVQDSGSNAGVTGSILWDGLCNKWVYSNPSGIEYSGGMLLSGPRTSTLGSEAPLTCNYIAKSGGGDHIYDSCIIDDGTTTCIKNNLVTTGTACFGSSVIATQSTNGEQSLSVINTNSGACAAAVFNLQNDTNSSQIVYTSSTYTGVYGCGANAINIINRNSGPINFLTAGYSNAAIRMVITNCGNVGIGTATPSTPLQILRDTTGNGNNIEEANMALTVLSATGQSKISIGASNAGNYGYIQVMQDGTSWTNRNLTLQPRGGNVGIGTYAPASTYGFSRSLVVSNPTNAEISLEATTYSKVLSIGVTDGFNYFQTTTGNGYDFQIGGGSKMRMTSAGITTFVCQVCISVARTSGTNSTALILQDNVTGIQTPGFGLRLVYQSNGTGVQSVIGLENGNTGTNNESQISFYTQNTAGGLSKRLLIDASGIACFSNVVCAASFGQIKGDSTNDVHSFTNDNAGNTYFCNRSGRLLTSNGASWSGDGRDPIMALVGSYSCTSRGISIGLALHNENNTTNVYSPMIAFSALSNSSGYNSTYASIMGKKTGTASGLDTNWNKGELHFYAHGETYIADTPTMVLSSVGVTKPFQPFVYGGLACDQSITTSNPTKVNFVANTGHFGCNVGSNWNNSTNQFTAPITGVYLVNLSGYWSANNMINQFAAFVGNARKVSIPTSYCTSIAGGSVMVPMAAGETMDFRVYNDTSTGTLYSNVYHTFFSIYLLG